jgi:hypothetical protein
MRVKSNKVLRRSARIAATVAGILWGCGGPAWAQEAAQPAHTGSAQTSESLQEVVVTASETPGLIATAPTLELRHFPTLSLREGTR